MNARQAPPDDWSGLLKKEEEALITIMKERALSSCSQMQKNYYECVKGRTLSIVWKCREEGNALNECLHRETSEEKLNDVKRKWIQAGKPRVGTRRFRRAKKVFSNSLMMSEGVTLNTLDGKKQDASITGMFQKMSAGRGLRSGSADDEMDDDFENADVFIIVNVSCGELPDVEQFVKTTSGGRPIIMLNNQLDTLRADLGLFSFPPKSLHYDFLSYFKPVFYLRSRAYSRSITVSPFVVNYSGAVFREYPAPWQVMIKQSNGVLACIAEDEDRFTLGEAKEEMLIALGLSDPEGSFMKTARSGLVVNTWWEEEDDAEKSDAWRT